jgi:hypothetical protein
MVAQHHHDVVFGFRILDVKLEGDTFEPVPFHVVKIVPLFKHFIILAG